MHYQYKCPAMQDLVSPNRNPLFSTLHDGKIRENEIFSRRRGSLTAHCFLSFESSISPVVPYGTFLLVKILLWHKRPSLPFPRQRYKAQ
jgi:hypothetical protein